MLITDIDKKVKPTARLSSTAILALFIILIDIDRVEGAVTGTRGLYINLGFGIMPMAWVLSC